MAMAAHTIIKNGVGSPSSCTTYDHDHDQRNKKRKRDDSNGRRRNNNWGSLTSQSIETNVVCVCLSLGGASCSTLSCSTENNKKKKTCNVDDDADVETLRNWECSTELMLYDDPWKIKKVLTQTDLGNNSRLLLNKELAHDLVVSVLGAVAAENEGVHVAVWDVDTDSLHSLVFKIRPSNKSPVFKETWIKEFVVRRSLKKGDEIGMHWDPYKKRFDFSVLRAFRRH
ncbi:putative DNA-binding pseudobarrel domain-containing protein [Medicago truncatula]|uniref:E1 protein n=2 Tax=Medicago truncatula TaxID=3880 RepID=G7I6Q3_MEDTR|nr:E1 protein [Medicago truncatula]RHN78691.1 putative DNA-binding pseudobarrel domain-containing protein [Medicago truncatula]